MDTTLPSQMVVWLKAAGEPSRLRLLALCGEGALTVSDLAQAMRQSEPRVSRHLKILCEAGLLARTREGQWVRYALAADRAAVSFVRGLLLQVDRRHPLLLRDRAEARAARSLDPEGGPSGSQPRLERALRAFVESSGFAAAPARVLLVGAAHLELLATARAATVLAPSRRAAQAVRSFAEARGLNCRVLPAAHAGELGEQDLARAGGPFDAVLCSPPAGAGELLGRLLTQLAGRLAPGGRLWVFQRYESLEHAHERIVEHPLARLRRLLEESHLRCERLSPIEADGEHLLAAAARPAGAAEDAAAGALRAGGAR
ncbi:MAG TPA: metalloregulator ArsR/SmtB family transcription factor [Steroidobacteraceae bacterium]|nr:metalloregulator ArsR/SmtB family transcription factor [Steroidobacteraceae bacterium]